MILKMFTIHAYKLAEVEGPNDIFMINILDIKRTNRGSVLFTTLWKLWTGCFSIRAMTTHPVIEMDSFERAKHGHNSTESQHEPFPWVSA